MAPRAAFFHRPSARKLEKVTKDNLNKTFHYSGGSLTPPIVKLHLRAWVSKDKPPEK